MRMDIHHALLVVHLPIHALASEQRVNSKSSQFSQSTHQPHNPLLQSPQIRAFHP